MKLTRVVLVAVTLSLGGCGCETVKSADIKTSGLYADLKADAAGDGQVKVKATLTLGSGSLTFLELSPGDTFTATVGPTSRALSRQSLLGSTWYEASFDGDAANTAVKIALLRGADTSAPESAVTLPAPFTFTQPVTGQAFSRSAGVTVNWSSAGPDLLRLGAKGSCVQSVDVELPSDTGTHSFPAFVPASGSETKTCDVAITLVRVRTGSVDPAYGKGGAFEATVTRSVTISSKP